MVPLNVSASCDTIVVAAGMVFDGELNWGGWKLWHVAHDAILTRGGNRISLGCHH